MSTPPGPGAGGVPGGRVPTRILVYGVTGSGKTTLARRLGERLDLPWHAVDDLTWEPGWVQVPVDEQRRRIEAICAGDSWVLDHAYGSWLDVPLARADLVVGLDFPRGLSLSRLVRRTARRLISREPVCNGNVESLRMALSRESIIAWHFQSFARKRARMRRWRDGPGGPPILLFDRPAAVERWLRTLPARPAADR